MSSGNIRIPTRSIVILATTWFVAVFVPLAVWLTKGTPDDDGWKSLLSTNFISVAAVIIGFIYYWLKTMKNRSQQDLYAAAALTIAIAYFWPAVLSSSTTPSFDYRCIQNGALNVLQGKLPYGVETGYVLYPPLYAESLAFAVSSLKVIARQFHVHPSLAQSFLVMFYIFQNVQYLACVSVVLLSYKFSRLTGRLGQVYCAIAAVLMTGLNYPMYCTLQWNQVNIFITAIVLFVLVFQDRMNALRGLALAVGIHLKVYPALLLPPLAISRQWKVCAWTVAWTAVIGALTLLPFGFEIWKVYPTTANTFIADITAHPPEYMITGANLFSIVWSFFRLGICAGLGHPPISSGIVLNISTIIKAALALWFGFRIILRHKQKDLFGSAMSDRRFRLLLDDACDLLSFGLLSGPTALHHHYALAIPVILWTAISRGSKRPFAVLCGALMIVSLQAQICKLMLLAPIGLILLAFVRSIRIDSQEAPPAQDDVTQREPAAVIMASTPSV